MGVNIYILDRRPARLSIGGVEQSVGSLRRFWKTTELDNARLSELEASEEAACAIASPSAAMLADVYDMPLTSDKGVFVKAHLVIGWDEGRASVTDMGWDYLPILGYGVRHRETGTFVLHEEKEGALYPVSRERAVEAGLISSGGQLVPHGQPLVVQCRSVRPYIAGYAEADCTFNNGNAVKLLIGVTGEGLPDPAWFVGKKPRQAEHYVPVRHGRVAGAGRRASKTVR